jgi:hypothetical protein
MPDWTSLIARWARGDNKPLVLLFWLAVALIAATLFSWIVPYVPQSLAVYLLVAIFWWLRTAWFPNWSPNDVPGVASFPIVSTAIIAALVLWFGCAALYDTYYHSVPVLEFPTLVAGLALAMATSLLLSLWLARLYWDTKTRLALLEQIVRESTGVDIAQRRRKYFAESQWRDQRPTFLLRQIAPEDLPVFKNESDPG